MLPGVLAAQDAHGYVDAGFMLSTQGAGTPPTGGARATPGIGGDALGVVGAFGLFVDPRRSLAVEISVPSRFEATQELRYSISQLYDNRHRDLIISGLLHVHYRVDRRVKP